MTSHDLQLGSNYPIQEGYQNIVGFPKQALGRFTSSSVNQIEFINLIVDHLTQNGVMAPALLYKSPFTDISQRCPQGVFESARVDELVSVLNKIRQTAAV